MHRRPSTNRSTSWRQSGLRISAFILIIAISIAIAAVRSRSIRTWATKMSTVDLRDCVLPSIVSIWYRVNFALKALLWEGSVDPVRRRMLEVAYRRLGQRAVLNQTCEQISLEGSHETYTEPINHQDATAFKARANIVGRY